ncbi:MAG: serine/threonine protein phosphatase [Methanophagales archaeon ANME-1-THS]|nr:MAG: serine/threonine protein phosphatase [Methanophagales archaeon ANME-1-THS]
MQTEVEALVKQAFEAGVEEFSGLINAAKNVFTREKELREGSGLVLTHPDAVRTVAVIGDIHGDIDSLAHILTDSDVENADRIIFLGDYGDRGTASVEVYHLLLTLKLSAGNGGKIILLRGNHEGPPDMPVMPHDLPFFFSKKYGARGRELYRRVKELWEYLPHAVLVPGSYLMLHGGLPAAITSIEEIAHAQDTHPATSSFEEILWSDPIEGRGYLMSTRGAGRMFGEDVTDAVLRATGVKTLIRSHEPCEGVEVQQRGKILTLFSRKGAPYYNNRAAYLIVDGAMLREARDASELARTAARIW